MRLLVEHVLLEFPQQCPLFRLVELAQQSVIKLGLLLIVEVAVIGSRNRLRQVFADVGQRVHHILAVALERDVEIPGSHRLEPGTG